MCDENVHNLIFLSRCNHVVIFSEDLFSGSNSLMVLMVSFSMKYFNWTSSCFSFLAAVLGVGWHDIGRLNTLDGRAGREYPPGNFTRYLVDTLVQLFRWVYLIVLYRACRALNQKSQKTTPPLPGGWTRPPVGQMASPQPEGDLRDHTSLISPQTHSPIPSHLLTSASSCFP